MLHMDALGKLKRSAPHLEFPALHKELFSVDSWVPRLASSKPFPRAHTHSRRPQLAAINAVMTSSPTHAPYNNTHDTGD